MKCILSFRVAKYLLAEGCRMVDIETSHKITGNVCFIFEDGPILSAAMSRLPKLPHTREER